MLTSDEGVYQVERRNRFVSVHAYVSTLDPALPSRLTRKLAVSVCVVTSGGGGGFFLALEDFGRVFDYSFPACAFSFFRSFLEISTRTLIPLLRPGSVHSGSEVETTVAECSLTSCV